MGSEGLRHMLGGASRGPCDSKEPRESAAVWLALDGEYKSQTEPESAICHGAGIGLLLTHATDYTPALVVRRSDEVEDNVRSPVAGTVSLILAKTCAILNM
jgi:hypothetical protein